MNGDFSEFLDRTGSLSIATESAGEPNRVEGRIAPIARTTLIRPLPLVSAYINAGSNDITEYHDDKGYLGGSFRIGYRELAERRDWVYGIHSAYSVRTMDKDYYHAIAMPKGS